MPWTGWLTIATFGVVWLAIHFSPELLRAAGMGLDRIPPKWGVVILAVTALGILLAIIMIPAGSMKN